VDIKLILTVEKVQGLMNLMGDTPAKMGFFPLMMKVKEQADTQIPETKEADKAT